jgi:hypothetical protein
MTDALRDELQEAIRNRKAVVIAGAGVSIQASGNPDIGGFRIAGWEGLLRHGVQHCQRFAATPDVRVKALESLVEAGMFLEAAEVITQELGGTAGGEFTSWLEETVGSLTLQDRAVPDALRDLQAPLFTTNYDTLLEKATQRPAVSWADGSRWQLVSDQPDVGIVHLHGSYDRPDTVVFGVRSYEDVLRDPGAQNALRALASTRSLVFVGFGAGIADPNFGGLRRFLSKVLADSTNRHYRVVPDEEVDKARGEHHKNERIVAVGHGAGHGTLAGFLESLAPPPPTTAPAALRLARPPRPVLEVQISNTEVTASVQGRPAVREPLQLDKLRLETVRLLDEWLRFQEDQGDAERSTQSHVATVLGSILFEAVFTGKVKELYRQQVKSASRDQPLSIVLRVRPEYLTLFYEDLPLALTSLPWELLCDYEDKSFLSTAPSLTLSRVYHGVDEPRGWEAPDKLRVLVVLAQPEELVRPVREEWDRDHSESYEVVVRKIVDTVRRVEFQSSAGDGGQQDAGIGMTGADEPATFDWVNEALASDEPPHIVHYIGHGRFRGGTYYLAFAKDGSDKADWQTFADFARRFDPDKAPILVFLHLCQGARAVPEQGSAFARANFSPLASDLIKRQVKMVVAMQYPASPDIGRTFTAKFYEDIRTRTVAEAVQSARKKAMDQGSAVGGPVLYLRGKDGVILSQALDQPAGGAGGTPRGAGAGPSVPPRRPTGPATVPAGGAPAPSRAPYSPAAQHRTVLQPEAPVSAGIPTTDPGGDGDQQFDGVVQDGAGR